MRTLPKLALSFPLLLLTAACATFGSQTAKQEVATEATPGLGADSRLDVGILIFDRGLAPDDEDPPERVYPGIRGAESYYFPCLLRITLQQTNQWGDVFLAPRASGAIELTLRAGIVESDGDRLALDVEARDATDRVWLEERYELSTSESDYYEGVEADPYQRMFNAIANDLVEARDRLSSEDLRAVRNVAALRFAEEFAPEAFEGYLEPDEDGVLRPVRLPARDDPMLARVLQARASEAMFVDTLNGHYEGLCDEMTESYLNWREHSRNEAIMYRTARRKKIAAYVAIPVVIAAAVFGGIAGAEVVGVSQTVGILGGLAIVELYSKAREYGAEADLHRASLEELDTSFEVEVAPMVVETEGTTHRITGSVDEQYEEWRRLLRKLYEAEAGVLSELDAHIERPLASADATPEETDLSLEERSPDGPEPEPEPEAQPEEEASP